MNTVWVLILLTGGIYVATGEAHYEMQGTRIADLSSGQQCRALGDAFVAAGKQPYAEYVCAPSMVLEQWEAYRIGDER